MKFFILSTVLLSVITGSQGCATHNPAPQIPQTYIGTVGQGCTPTVITAVTQLVTDPLRCELSIGRGCNLCNLRLYKPEVTTSRFLVQPLTDDTTTHPKAHVEATKCKCSEGCYFHRSSVTQLGIEPLPTGTDGTAGSFSEPFACFSGSFMPTLASAPTYTYLIWCENDGGCPNNLVARYSFLIRFELSSPNRPPTKSNFTPKVTSLPETSCIYTSISEKVRNFLNGKTEKKSNKNKPKNNGGGTGRFTCAAAKSVSRCLTRCTNAGKSGKSVHGAGRYACATAKTMSRCTSRCLESTH